MEVDGQPGLAALVDLGRGGGGGRRGGRRGSVERLGKDVLDEVREPVLLLDQTSSPGMTRNHSLLLLDTGTDDSDVTLDGLVPEASDLSEADGLGRVGVERGAEATAEGKGVRSLEGRDRWVARGRGGLDRDGVNGRLGELVVEVRRLKRRSEKREELLPVERQKDDWSALRTFKRAKPMSTHDGR